jgi:UDP-2,4-diacetamido-2,4,6-trideoxy-beta-L-altropyranose hydrolase
MHAKAAVLFRCDAGLKHGLGHLSRCLTLADTMARAGIQSAFVVHAPEGIRRRVLDAGYAVVAAEAPIGTGDEPAGWIAEGTRVVVVDSKDNTASYTARCRALRPVACFDEKISRELLCDVLINNHIWARLSDYDVRTDRRLLIGPAFNTVHPSYFGLAEPRRGLLITLGGEDPLNHTAWLIDALADAIGTLPTLVCIGPAHPDPDSVLLVCKKRLPATEVFVSPPSLVSLAARCHLALSAGGSTCYELAAAGIASAVLAIEEHQVRLVTAMVAAGAALSLGKSDRMDKQSVRQTFASLQQPDTAASLRSAGRSLFPQPGAPAIVAELREFLGPRGSSTRHRAGAATAEQRQD